jgi:hypothetical protein
MATKPPRLTIEEQAAQEAAAIGRLDVTRIVEQVVDSLPMATRLYPDIYAHKITEALLEAGVLSSGGPDRTSEHPPAGSPGSPA